MNMVRMCYISSAYIVYHTFQKPDVRLVPVLKCYFFGLNSTFRKIDCFHQESVLLILINFCCTFRVKILIRFEGIVTYMTSVIEIISKLQFVLSPSRNTDLISAVLTKSPNFFLVLMFFILSWLSKSTIFSFIFEIFQWETF